jgi:hypothetical protein
VGRVTAILTPPDGTDVAFLKVAGGSAFDGYPAIDVTQLATQSLSLGTAIYQDGAIEGGNSAMQIATGIYLGEYSTAGDPATPGNVTSRSYHLVAAQFDSADPSGPCTSAAGGATAIGPDGRILGVLSYSAIVSDSSRPSATLAPSDPIAQERAWLERLTGISLAGQWMVCAYSAATSDTIAQLARNP